MSRQLDLLAPLAADAKPAAIGVADPDEVRAELAAIVAEARAADETPWDSETLRLYRTIVPQMSRWLPEAEAAEIVAAFRAELARLGVGG